MLPAKPLVNMETASLASSTTLVAHGPSSPSSSMINVPIPLSALLSPEEITRLDTYRGQCDRTFWITRLINRKKDKQSSGGEPKERVKDVRMSREEYEAYWATDEEGKYVGTEPEGKGRVIVRDRLWAELGLFGRSARTGKSDRDRHI